MNSTAPYMTPQERRRQKAIERQLPPFPSVSDTAQADGDARRTPPAADTAPLGSPVKG